MSSADRIAHDITERKRAEDALRDAKEFSENLIRTANVMILGLDTDGNINLLNDAGEEMIGYSFTELKGKAGRFWYPESNSRKCGLNSTVLWEVQRARPLRTRFSPSRERRALHRVAEQRCESQR